jgi:Protein of unknown function (DUF2934)
VEKGTSKRPSSPTQIRQRAFEIYIERGGIHGCDLDDWLQAEREFPERTANKKSPESPAGSSYN